MAKRRLHRGTMRLLESELLASVGPGGAVSRFDDGFAVEPSMPSPPWRDSHYPGKAHLLKHAAAQGQLILVKCVRCRRRVVFLAEDLIKLFDPEQDALLPPFPCSRCGTTEFLRVECRVYFADEVGNLLVRRPGPVRRTQLWRTVKLGDG